MTQITRRTILGGLAATASPLPALAAPAPALSPEERVQAAIAELKAAVSAATPDIQKWEIQWTPDDERLPLMILAFGDR